MVTGEPLPVNAPQSFAAGAAGVAVTTGAAVTGAAVTGAAFVTAGAFVTTGAEVAAGAFVTGGTIVVVAVPAIGARIPRAPTTAGRSRECTMPTPTVVSAKAGKIRRTMDGLR